MQKILVGLPYEVKVTPCGVCSDSPSRCGCNYAKYKGMAITLEVCNTPISTTVYDPYKNNMVAINHNFDHVVQLNRQLSEQIKKLNGDISQLMTQIETNTQSMLNFKTEIQQLQHELVVVNQTISENTTQIVNTEKEMKTLVKKVGIIVSYIPRFVRETSEWFVRLMIGVKTNSLDSLEFSYDTKLITDIA